MPAALRVALLFVLAGGVAAAWGPNWGMAVVAPGLLLLLLVQLRYLQRLAQWLDAPQERLPEGWGAWSEVFARLYRLRREDDKARAELSEWLARFREAMARLPDGVAIIDEVLFLEWCNPAAEQHLGLDLSRDCGLRITNLIRNPRFIDYMVMARFDEPLELEIGERRYRLHIIPFQTQHRILVSHDVTQAERTERMRRDFIANASHELRTPLTVINGFLELDLSEEQMPAEVRQRHLNLMLEQGRRMQGLIDDMLALTRLESLESPLHAEPVAMQALLGEVMDNARALSAGRHRLELKLDGPDLRGSPEELRSALLNLVSNAVRYTPDGGRICVEWKGSDAGPVFTVRDTGIGIAPEHIPRLTERFYRVDKSRSRETQGTGLGLAIVKHVLMRHGATLEIASTPGRGSVFTARFPRSAQALSQ